jgi:hypothetical protein
MVFIEASKHNIQKKPISGSKYCQPSRFNIQRWRSQDNSRSVTHVYSTCQSYARFKDEVQALKSQIKHRVFLLIVMINFYFRSFSSSPHAFIQSILSRRLKFSTTCPSQSNGGSLISEFHFSTPIFLRSDFLSKLQIKHRVFLQIRRSIFTLGIWALRVLAPPLSLSSGLFSPKVHRYLSHVHSNQRSSFSSELQLYMHTAPRALNFQSTWKSLVQTYGTLISHDT